MSGWRDGASAQAQDDLDGLLGAALPFAQQQLERHGEFFPYAAVVTSTGRAELVATALDGQPAATEVLAASVAAVRDRRHEVRACAFVADVALPDRGQDAVEVALEHAEGAVLRVQLPYVTTATGVEYGALRAVAGTRQVWAD